MLKSNSLAAIFLCLVLLSFTGCSGGILGTGGGEDSDLDSGGVTGTGDGNEYSQDVTGYKGQAVVLGPVVGASVEIFNYSSLSERQCLPVETKRSDDMASAGEFLIPSDCVDEDGLYLVVISGGESIVDEIPTPVLGSFRTILTADQIRDSEWKVTGITELISQNIQYLRENGWPQADIMSMIDLLAPLFVSEDISRDGTIDAVDLLEWDPQADFETLLTPTLFSEAVDNVHQGPPGDTLLPEGWAEDNVSVPLSNVSGARLVVVNNDIVYLIASQTDESSTLQILELGDNYALSLLGSYETTLVTDLQVDGDHVYLAQGENGLLVLDVSEFSNPKMLARLDTKIDRILLNAESRRLMAAAVTTIESSVMVVNIEQTDDPVILDRAVLPGGTLALDFVKDSTTLALSVSDLRDQTSVVYRFDSSDPDFVTEVSSETYVGKEVTTINIVDGINLNVFNVPEFYGVTDVTGVTGGNKFDDPMPTPTAMPTATPMPTPTAVPTSTPMPAPAPPPTTSDSDDDSLKSLSGSATSLVKGDYIYSFSDAQLTVRSAADLTELGSVSVPGDYDRLFGPDVDFDIENNTAYIVSREYGLIIVDLSSIFSN